MSQWLNGFRLYRSHGAITLYVAFITGHTISNGLCAYASNEKLREISKFKNRHSLLKKLDPVTGLYLIDEKLERIDRLEEDEENKRFGDIVSL